jgi:hypothetical protein
MISGGGPPPRAKDVKPGPRAPPGCSRRPYDHDRTTALVFFFFPALKSGLERFFGPPAILAHQRAQKRGYPRRRLWFPSPGGIAHNGS